MKIKNNLIISFGKCAIEMEKGDEWPEGNAILHISSLSKGHIRKLRELFPGSIKFIEAYRDGDNTANMFTEGHMLILAKEKEDE